MRFVFGVFMPGITVQYASRSILGANPYAMRSCIDGYYIEEIRPNWTHSQIQAPIPELHSGSRARYHNLSAGLFLNLERSLPV
jgi:hypothetical protein